MTGKFFKVILNGAIFMPLITIGAIAQTAEMV
jgi:hypothetical protein